MRGTKGVGYVLINSGGAPRMVAAEQIDALLAAVARPAGRAPAYRPGERVTALSGPFATFGGVVIHDAGERVQLLHQLLGRPTRHWYRPEDVEAA